MEFVQVGSPNANDEFVQRFARCSLQELVDAFNREVGCTGWVSARGRYLVALYEELRRRPVDISVIDNGRGLRLARRVRLDAGGERLALAP
jgi:hypothetical protein